VEAGKVFRLTHRTRVARVVDETRAAVESGGAIAWVWSRDADFRRAAQHLGDWRAPNGGTWRLGHGRSLAWFAADPTAANAFTYWNRSKGA
jgi:hypothetical protein